MRSLGGTSSTYWFCTIDSTSVNSRSCSYVAALSVTLLAADPPSESVNTTSNAPVTNAFFMESPWLPLSAPCAEPLLGILGLALEAHLEVEARPFQRARVPDRSNFLTLAHVVAFLHQDIGDVRVQRVVLVVVIQNDQIAVALEPARIDDVATEHGAHLASLAGLDVDAVPEGTRAKTRVDLGAEGRDDPPFCGPRQSPAKSTKADRRWLDARLGRRHLGDAALLGLQIADERLELARGFGELADHSLVVGSLVAHPGQEGTPLRGVAIDFGLLALGVGFEIGQLPLSKFFPAPTVVEPV